MKTLRFLFRLAILIVICYGCNTENKKKIENSNKVFNHTLEIKLEEFINYYDGWFGTESFKMPYNISFYKEDNDCYLKISLDFFYEKEYTKWYTYFDNKLFICNDDSNCNIGFIDENRLTKFKDTIPQYFEISNPISDNLKYRSAYRIYKIIDLDSLVFIRTNPIREDF